MKDPQKKVFIISGLIIISLAIYIFITLFEKEIYVIGFAYPNDIIRVTQSDFMTHTFKVDTTNTDSNRVGSFYEKFSYFTFNGNASVNIEIDSSGIKLLDTLLVFDEKNTVPFVSFEKPTENKFKRKFFVGDYRKVRKK